MTSRERVLKALNHEEPDRVPLDLGGTFVTGIAAVALDRLRRHLGLEERPVKVFDVLQMLGEVQWDVVERLQLDAEPVEPAAMTFGIRRGDWKPWRLHDGTEVLMPGMFDVEVTPQGDWLLHAGGDSSRPAIGRMPKDGHYFDAIDFGGWDADYEPPPLEQLRVASKHWLITDEDLAYLQPQAEQWRRDTDKAVVLGAWPYTGLKYVGRFAEFLCLLSTDRPYVRALFELSTDVAVENLGRLWETLGENVDVIAVTGLDFGTQRAGFFSQEVFQETYLPALKRQFDWIHEHTTWKIFEHSCGSVAHIIPDFVEAGLDALNPVQTSAGGMDPQWLKETFGDRLTFWGGGVETQSTLPFGTPEEVREAVRERMQVFAPGGGFVFNPIHNIQADTPPENITAAYEAAREFGDYPIG